VLPKKGQINRAADCQVLYSEVFSSPRGGTNARFAGTPQDGATAQRGGNDSSQSKKPLIPDD